MVVLQCKGGPGPPVSAGYPRGSGMSILIVKLGHIRQNECSSQQAARRKRVMTAAITPVGSVEIVDRSSMIAKLNEGVTLRPRETTIVTIDMHRGHLDMEVATMAAKPDDARRVIANAKEIIDFARTNGMPISQCKRVFR